MAPVLKPIVKKVAHSVDFKYDMEEHLPNVKGKVMIIRNRNDEVISVDHHNRMLEALKNRDGVAAFTITNPHVKHAGAWFNDVDCENQVVDHLISSGFSDGDILA